MLRTAKRGYRANRPPSHNGMTSLLTAGQAAARTGLIRKALRVYEAKDLLPMTPSSSGDRDPDRTYRVDLRGAVNGLYDGLGLRGEWRVAPPRRGFARWCCAR